jgi:hypothetical protein
MYVAFTVLSCMIYGKIKRRMCIKYVIQRRVSLGGWTVVTGGAGGGTYCS